jgi:hypothetical protein
LNLRDTMRSLSLGAVWLGLGLGLGGCRHQVSAWVPPAPQPVALADVPENLTEELSAPVEELPEVPVASAAESMRSPVRRRPRVPTTTPATSTPGGNAAEPAPDADEAVGELTTEEETTPQARQAAVDLIASTDERLKALPGNVVASHRTQIGKVRNFQRQAQHALASGDAQGANTLATKGKLLLDDLLK